jgi:hypothetical protein
VTRVARRANPTSRGLHRCGEALGRIAPLLGMGRNTLAACARALEAAALL